MSLFSKRKPLPTDGMTVELRLATLEEVKRENRFYKKVKRWLSYPFQFFDKFYRTGLILKHKEMSEPIAKTNDYRRFTTPFYTFFMNYQIVNHEPMMRAFLKAPRNSGDADGLFKSNHGIEEMVGFVRLVYPNEKITLDDCIFTTRDKVEGVDLLAKYRQPLLEFIGPMASQHHISNIYEIVLDKIAHLNESFLLAPLCGDYSFSVLSKLLLGHPGPFEKMTEAVEFYNQWMIKSGQRRALNDKEKERLESSLETFRIEIDKVIELAKNNAPNTEYVQSLLNNPQYTSIQIKTMLIVLFFAGHETSSALLTYLLWQLARHPDIQAELAAELETNDLSKILESRKLTSVVMEALRLFNSVYFIYREAAHDLIYTVKESEEIIHQQVFSKGTPFFSCPFLASRNPMKYPKADQFNPKRFDSETFQSRNMSWLPFGFGKHACPGQWLAFLEIKLFVIGMLKNYALTTDTQTVSFKGFATLQIGNEIVVKAEKRK
jgi:cytochrome P450